MPDAINWDAIGKGSPVIVMYMAMKHIAQISANLIAAGRSADEPVAFVCNAATSAQQVLETTLGRATADVEASGLEPPAIVVVGEVVKLRPSLDWLGALAGRSCCPRRRRVQKTGIGCRHERRDDSCPGIRLRQNHFYARPAAGVAAEEHPHRARQGRSRLYRSRLSCRRGGSPCLNFDPWAMRPELISANSALHRVGGRMLVIEAMMGLFDGAADGSGSPADLAALLNLPIVLVIDVSRMSHSVAAVVSGFANFRADIRIAGVVLNRVASERHEGMLRRALDAVRMPVLP